MNELATQTNEQLLEHTTQTGTVLLNTVDTTNIEGSKLVINSINNAKSLASLNEDAILYVCDCIIMQGCRRGRGGQPDEPCANIYLIDNEGNAWFSQSEGIFRSVGLIYSMFNDFGKSTDEGYLAVQVVTQKLQNGNTTKNLILL